jgi:uncharacterized protein (DUF924 family)
MAEIVTPSEILNFWFRPDDSREERIQLWFGGAPELDEEIRRRFEPTIQAAVRGELDDWKKEPESTLALILLLDQFPLNIYRDQAKSFQTIEKALPVTLHALEQKFDQKLTPFQRVFVYLPLEHSEDMKMQEKSMEMFRKLRDEATPENKEAMEIFYDYARRHYVVVERFGRYPDRNPILGRPHRPEEAKYMSDGGPDF